MNNGQGLVGTMHQIGAEIDRDLAQGNRQRAQSHAHLAATIMATQGQSAQAADVNDLMSFGEQFYRWKLFGEGMEYWKALFQLIRKYVGTEHDYATRALTIAAAFSLLGGTMKLTEPVAQSTLSMLKTSFGDNHPLTKDCVAKVQAAQGGGGWSTAGASAGPFSGGAQQGGAQQAHAFSPKPGHGPVDMTPKVEKRDTSLKLGPKEELSLWITLAFLDIAMADGKVSDEEYLVWKRTIAAFELPDLWDKITTQGLVDLLKQGLLQVLSSNFANLDRPTKITLGKVLKQIVFADGVADPREIDAVRRIVGWIGLSITDIP
jgi:uncharacterized tellurite resistance protein B-like protein